MSEQDETTSDRVARLALGVPSDDHRARAALAVIAGEPVEDVAARVDAPEALVVRWTRQFVDGGVAAHRGEGPVDTSGRDRFLSLLSHELRTPLSVIQGWLDTLRTIPGALDDTEMVETALRAMAGHSARLTRLADDLADTAAVTLGRLGLIVDDVELCAVAADVASSFEGDQITVDAPERVTLRGDRDRIRQLTTNLLHDALRRTRDPVRLRVSSLPPWAMLTLEVPVEPPPFEEMHALFEPFEAGSGDPHTGLGLYVCRALAVAHGGQCGVDAEQHLRYWVRLPLTGPAVGLDE